MLQTPLMRVVSCTTHRTTAKRGYMPRRRLGILAFAACVAGLLAAAPARAQETLGFTIDPTQGVPGTTVTGQVDVEDIQAFCATDLEEFQAQFAALLTGPFNNGEPSGELFQRFFPGLNDYVFDTCERAAYSLTGITVFAIAQNFSGAAETALPQTFVMTFVDPVTLDPIGELGSFDPTTGEGSVVVPDVTPGPWPVAATCVEPTLDLDLLEAGIRENGAFLESLNPPTCDINSAEFGEWVESILGEGADLFLFLGTFGPTFIQNIVVPDALGLQIFTVLATPAERIADVVADIQALVDAGDLQARHARALIKRLESAARSLEKGRLESACRKLASFVKVATARVRAGLLEEAAAQALITEVESIREQLGCDAPASPSGAFLDTGEACS